MSEHVVPPSVYFRVYAALVVLTLANIGVAFLRLGFWGTIFAASIAFVQALLVILYFMHVRYSNRFIWVVAGAGFAWLTVLIVAVVTDVLTRP